MIKTKVLRYVQQHSVVTAGVVVGLLVIAGSIIIATKAATPTIAVEPENGKLFTEAVIKNDTTASGGRAIKFTEPASPLAPTTNVEVMSWNAEFSNPMDNIIGAIKSWDNVDVIALQEFADDDRRARLERALVSCDTCEFNGYTPIYREGGSNPIIWRRATTAFENQGYMQVYEAGLPIEDGANGTVSWAMYITWVKLRNRETNQAFYVLNNHFIPTIEVDGRPDPNRPKRVALYDKNMTMLLNKVDEFRATGNPVFVTGDFNIDYRKDSIEKSPLFPYVRMDNHNMWANWRFLGLAAGPTAGTRYIDYVAATRNPKVVPVSQIVRGKNGSDHSPVQVRFQFTP